MPIDWFTVGAQALNFLILVWLMKRFLYKPILNAIDAGRNGLQRNSPTPTPRGTQRKRNATNSSTRTKSSISSTLHS